MKKPFILIVAAAVAAVCSGKPLGDGTKAWFGTNYTVPFAHAYRALGALGVDRKEAIDRDVYHMSRLGLNAFRVHLWDVELTDSAGNLLNNNHLDLMDYLISRLDERGIDIILTAQTNFGNGYPERNTDPNGAFTYRYPKCGIHEDPLAQAAQERYLGALARHVNPYTGKSYAGDPRIVAVEINNEPCHSGSGREVTAYIDRMARALRKAGWEKPVLYNVSHNPGVTESYYRAKIDGTTYQWYPVGLVRGATRKGNFLPYVDAYAIPFDTIAGFGRKSRVVYEFDPADNLNSYVIPAAVRSLRKAGFEWMTQFAYDPIDMAQFNTEYQTHYLNLAYTPRKAIGMMVAGEIARRTPLGADYGKYPADTVFGDFTVSARRDLAMLDDGRSFIYSNSTDVVPKNAASLTLVAGVGSSPVVGYDGSGAYFLDRIAPGIWRLELMPDVVYTADPFSRPSLTRPVAEIIAAKRPIAVRLPDLPDDFSWRRIDGRLSGRASGSAFEAEPGVYLLGGSAEDVAAVDVTATFGDGTKRIDEFVAPHQRVPQRLAFVHSAPLAVQAGTEMTLRATVCGPEPVDSVVVFPADISFWREDNRLYPMRRSGLMEYEATVPAGDYSIVVYCGGRAVTYPGARSGAPLDWDFDTSSDDYRYSPAVYTPGEPVVLIAPASGLDGVELSTIPGRWEGVGIAFDRRAPLNSDVLRLSLGRELKDHRAVLSKYVGDIVASRSDVTDSRRVYVALGNVAGLDSITVGLVNGDGFTYSATLPVDASRDVVSVGIDELSLSPTLLVPEPFPTFLPREFVAEPSAATPLRLDDLSVVTLSVVPRGATPSSMEIRGVWLD